MNICTFKLTSGDEIVCERITETDTCITVKNMHGVQVTGVDNTGHLQVRLLPFVIVDPNGTRTVYKHSIMTEPCSVSAAVESLFIQQTTVIQIVQP